MIFPEGIWRFPKMGVPPNDPSHRSLSMGKLTFPIDLGYLYLRKPP
jgi:hypothetical protein